MIGWYHHPDLIITVLEERHCLDGPAYVQRDPMGFIVCLEWYVKDVRLPDFDEYAVATKNRKERLFEYVKKYPHLSHEIAILAQHNKWLTEEQILLLKTTALLF